MIRASRRKLRPFVFFFAVFIASRVFLSFPLAAQTTFGSITGTVTDPSGAVIPSVQVTVTNQGTGATRQVTSGSSGTFNIPDLGVGIYTIHIEAAGFKAYNQTDLTLNANQVLGLNARLVVAGDTTTVEVQATAGVINTETSTLSYPKDNNFVEQLPTVSRSAADVGIFGYVYTNPGVAKAGQGDPTVNGGRMLDTVLSLDGIQVNAYVSGMGGGPTQPSLEAVQEVNVNLAGTSAEFARAADITVITKSGTNSFHGDAYYDYNGDDLNARNFFSPTVPFRVYNNFAGAIGGPVRKDKTFFFATYDGSREAATTTVTNNVPLPAWRTGDFTGLKAIIDPTTGQPFPGNMIPGTRISPVSTAIENFFFPLPNNGAPGQQANNWTGNLFANTGYTHYDTWSGRVDEILSSKDTVFARYNYRKSIRAIEAWPEGNGLEIRPTQGAVASWTHIFSSTVLNELRAGFVRNWDGTRPDEIGSALLSQFGITGIPSAGVPNPPGFVISGVATTNIGTSSAIGGNNDNLGIDTDFEYTDNVNVTRGRHLMKFGADWIHDAVSGFSEPSSIYGRYIHGPGICRFSFGYSANHGGGCTHTRGLSSRQYI
jgi:hypothetical protein